MSHLFNPSSGFNKARQEGRNSITIWKDQQLSVNLLLCITPWNNLAGWGLFRIVSFPSSVDVRLQSSHRTIVLCGPSYTEPFEVCIIHTSPEHDNTHSITHELGHCLGFADHLTAAAYGQDPELVNPGVHDDPSHHAYQEYHGVMCYHCWRNPERWFGPDDRRMLKSAKYFLSS